LTRWDSPLSRRVRGVLGEGGHEVFLKRKVRVMEKRDLVVEISNEMGNKVKQFHVKQIVQRTLDHITAALIRGERVELRKFGVFKITTRKPRMGRDPRLNIEIPIPERKVVVFKPGLLMRKVIMGKKR